MVIVGLPEFSVCNHIIMISAESGVENTNIFGRPISKVVGDEMSLKTGAMPEETRKKVRRTISKMVNDGKYRVIYVVY